MRMDRTIIVLVFTYSYTLVLHVRGYHPLIFAPADAIHDSLETPNQARAKQKDHHQLGESKVYSKYIVRSSQVVLSFRVSVVA